MITYIEPTLLGLPDELLLDIADWLHLIDIVSLSLCNYDLSLKFSRYRKSRDLAESSAREDLLIRLARDDPKQFYCYSCLRLHHASDVPSPALAGNPNLRGLRAAEGSLRCVTNPVGNARFTQPKHIHGLFSAYRIVFQHIQLATKLRWPGQQAFLRKLATVEIQDRITLLSVEARLIDGQIFLRVQQWARIGLGILSTGGSLWNIIACAHIEPRTFYASSLTRIIDCKICHSQHCETCQPLLTCRICKTDYQFNVIDHHDRRYKALVLTKWLNLGRGEHPSDPQWTAHSPGQSVSRGEDIHADKADVKNGTRATFERVDGESASAMSNRNKAYLDREVYTKLLKRHPGSYWAREDLCQRCPALILEDLERLRS